MHLRPIVPEDAEALQAMHARLSEQTRYFRFFGPYPVIPPRDLERFTVVDHDKRCAIVAVLGGRIIGVARYEGLGSGVAEVAFVIEDAHQGRGLGPLLLEHLAAAARERGISRFEADVLPTNRRMLRVFLAAGYAAERHFDSGTMHVTFAIEPTMESIAASRLREQHAEARSVRRVLTPSTLVVAGASAERTNVGRAVLHHVVAGGFTGGVAAVHPRASKVGEVPAYRSVTEVPGEVDVVVVAVPAAAVLDVLHDCVRKNVHGVVVVSAGFAETGRPDDARRQEAMVRLAHDNGMRIVGPNCLGIVNTSPEVSLNASLAPVVPSQGRLGMFTQSGTLGNVILADAAARGLGLSTFISAGNRADVSGNDLLQFWEDDEDTEVVLLYIESFGNPRKFTRLARRLSGHKPVVVVRAGRLAAPAPAGRVPAHGEEALLAQAGVVQVDTLAAGLDVATLLASQPLPAGRRVGVVGNSSAIGMLTVAAVERAELTAAGGVVDLGSTADGASYAAAVTEAVTDDQVDAVVVIYAPALGGEDADVAAAIGSAAGGCRKPVVAMVRGVVGLNETLGSVPSYRSPEIAVAALAKAVTLAEWRARPVGALPDLADVDTDRARALVAGAGPSTTGAVALGEQETIAVLGAVGITVSTAVRADSVQAALLAARRIGWPVAVKAADANLRRRTDLGAVRLDISSPRQLRAAYDAVMSVAGGDVLVQRMAPPGVAVTIDVFDEPSFGAVVSVGLGGLASELLGDRAFRAVPLTDVDAAEMVRSLRASPLLLGWRGAEPVDVAALEDLLLRVSMLADELPELVELCLGSVLVGRNGVTVLEAEASVGPAHARPDSGPRHLT